MKKGDSWTLKDTLGLLAGLAVIGGILFYGVNADLFTEPDTSGGIEAYRDAHPEYFAHPQVDHDAAALARAQSRYKEEHGHYASGDGVLERLQRVDPDLTFSEAARPETMSIRAKKGLEFSATMEYEGLDEIARCRIGKTFGTPNSDWSRVCWNGGGDKVLTGGQDVRDEIVAEHPELK